MMMKYFSPAYLKNLSTHAQASPISDLHQSLPPPAKTAYLLRHYGDASQILNILTKFSFFKKHTQFSIHAMHYSLIEFSVLF